METTTETVVAATHTEDRHEITEESRWKWLSDRSVMLAQRKVA